MNVHDREGVAEYQRGRSIRWNLVRPYQEGYSPARPARIPEAHNQRTPGRRSAQGVAEGGPLGRGRLGKELAKRVGLIALVAALLYGWAWASTTEYQDRVAALTPSSTAEVVVGE